MKLPKILRAPISRLRNRRKARSEVGPIEDQIEVDPAAPRPAESTPDLPAGPSISPAPSPSIPRDQEFNGMEPILSRLIHLSPFLRTTLFQTPTQIESCLSPGETRAPSRSLRVIQPVQEQYPRTNRIGNPLRTLHPG